jgi:subtilisin family serine protease
VFAIEPSAPAAVDVATDETTFTWGLQAVGAPNSTATGEGIRVAVLDTGFDLAHPDFAGRTIVPMSFVQGEEVQDGHGHGTHCIGTSCGPREVAGGPGYGIAYKADIYAGKVLSNKGSGADGGILQGISWAISNGCSVVSMSLGAPTQPGQAYSRTFEQVALRALSRGTLIVAAAGNESKRPDGLVSPVGHPANCPSILAVGAVDVHGAIAWFSCGTVDATSSVDMVGPGVDVHSSWPMPLRNKTISGTSMATPHAAGVAALIAQATGARAYELWARLAQTAKRLPLVSTDVGSGTVQAP